MPSNPAQIGPKITIILGYGKICFKYKFQIKMLNFFGSYTAIFFKKRSGLSKNFSEIFLNHNSNVLDNKDHQKL